MCNCVMELLLLLVVRCGPEKMTALFLERGAQAHVIPVVAVKRTAVKLPVVDKYFISLFPIYRPVGRAISMQEAKQYESADRERMQCEARTKQ